MEIFSSAWFSALAATVLIDLVVIGLLVSVPTAVSGSTRAAQPTPAA